MHQLHLLLQPPDLFGAAALFGGNLPDRKLFGFAFDEQDQRMFGSALPFPAAYGLHLQIGSVRRAVEMDKGRRRERIFAALECAVQGSAQLEPQFLTDQLRDVGAERSALGLEIAPGRLGNVHHAQRLVDENTWRRGGLQGLTMKLESSARSGGMPVAERQSEVRPGAEQARRKHGKLIACASRGLKDSIFAINGAEESAGMLSAFGRAEEQEPVGIQSIVENAQNLLLHVPLEIDEKVAARDQILPRERRILQQAVIGEKHHVPQFALDPEELAIFRKKPLQAILAHIRPDRRGILSLARDGERA